jgi:hypothetical protein
MKHNLNPGTYVVDPSTCVVIAGPFANAREARERTGGETCPCCVLEVTGGIVGWSAGFTPLAEAGVELPPYQLTYKERCALQPKRNAQHGTVTVDPDGEGGLRQTEFVPDAEPCGEDV